MLLGGLFRPSGRVPPAYPRGGILRDTPRTVFPAPLKPLLAIVIVMAIAHTLLKLRARAMMRPKASAAKRGAKPPIQGGTPEARTPEDALAELHRAAQEHR